MLCIVTTIFLTLQHGWFTAIFYLWCLCVWSVVNITILLKGTYDWFLAFDSLFICKALVKDGVRSITLSVAIWALTTLTMLFFYLFFLLSMSMCVNIFSTIHILIIIIIITTSNDSNIIFLCNICIDTILLTCLHSLYIWLCLTA